MGSIILGTPSAGGALSFSPLPEAESAADANNYVAEFNEGATTNVTGVGGGLAGADLVLTQSGGVGASVGGWTPISDGSSQKFTPTVAWVNNFVTNASGFSLLWHLRNFNASLTANRNLFTVLDSTGNLRIESYIPSSGYVFEVRETGSYGAQFNSTSSDWSSILPSADDVYILSSVDYTNDVAFFGLSVGSDQPGALTDFSIYSISCAGQSAPSSIASFVANRDAIIGSGSSDALGLEIKSLTARLGPSVAKV